MEHKTKEQLKKLTNDELFVYLKKAKEYVNDWRFCGDECWQNVELRYVQPAVEEMKKRGIYIFNAIDISGDYKW